MGIPLQQILKFKDCEAEAPKLGLKATTLEKVASGQRGPSIRLLRQAIRVYGDRVDLRATIMFGHEPAA